MSMFLIFSRCKSATSLYHPLRISQMLYLRPDSATFKVNSSFSTSTHPLPQVKGKTNAEHKLIKRTTPTELAKLELVRALETYVQSSKKALPKNFSKQTKQTAKGKQAGKQSTEKTAKGKQAGKQSTKKTAKGKQADKQSTKNTAKEKQADKQSTKKTAKGKQADKQSTEQTLETIGTTKKGAKDKCSLKTSNNKPSHESAGAPSKPLGTAATCTAATSAATGTTATCTATTGTPATGTAGRSKKKVRTKASSRLQNNALLQDSLTRNIPPYSLTRNISPYGGLDAAEVQLLEESADLSLELMNIHEGIDIIDHQVFDLHVQKSSESASQEVVATPAVRNSQTKKGGKKQNKGVRNKPEKVIESSRNECVIEGDDPVFQRVRFLRENQENSEEMKRHLVKMEKILEEFRYGRTKGSQPLLPENFDMQPFWNTSELKTMEDWREASRIVRYLNRDISRAHSIALSKKLGPMKKQLNYDKDALAYVQACLQSQSLKKAQTFLLSQEVPTKKRRRNLHVTSIEPFNQLMFAWAKLGQECYGHIESLLRQASHLGIPFDVRTHACRLYKACSDEPDQLPPFTLAVKVAANMMEQGLDVNALRRVRHPNSTLNRKINETLEMLKKAESLPAEIEFGAAEKDDEDYVEGWSLIDKLQNTLHKPAVNPHVHILSANHLSQLVRKQLADEVRGTVHITSIAKDNYSNTSSQLEMEKRIWEKAIREAFNRDKKVLEAEHKQSAEVNIVPFLRVLPVNTFVDIMMQEISNLTGELYFNCSLETIQILIGNKVFSAYCTVRQKESGYVDKIKPIYDRYAKKYTQGTLSSASPSQLWSDACRGQHLSKMNQTWSVSLVKSVGKFLLNIILADVKVNVHLNDDESSLQIPAFYTACMDGVTNQGYVIKPHANMIKLFQHGGHQQMAFPTTFMPMLCPPLPWTDVKSGGNLLQNTDFIRHPNHSEDQIKLLEKIPKKTLQPILDSLNVVSATPWRINKPVLDTVIKIFNDGGDKHLDIPCHKNSIKEPDVKLSKELSKAAYYEVVKSWRKWRKDQNEAHSLWMTLLYRLSIANHIRDDVFWFPHNLDFRGRSYATPPHFNHLGGDLARSLLLFAKGKPLGNEGLDWLKIHLINLTGLRKRCSNAERLRYCNEVLDEVLDSADNPLTGRRWWYNSDEPLQTLACCIEIAKALRSPDPSQYKSFFPVHQDGSCNGLQHYAALGRDQAGAESVNLAPFDAPSDVYSDVVELVEQERAADAANGVEIARVLEGFIQRKVIKQTIMTTVYGVTRYGARLQIKGQLEDIESFPHEKTFEASLYLVRKTFYCLQKMFTATKQIQEWLTLSAELTSSIANRPIAYTTPLAFPVIQPYYRTLREVSKVLPGGRRLYRLHERPNNMRQKNAFPPNFIHSLDSTHMMLTALYCLRAGITFVSVHDCFWTHACDINTMNKICREQFVALHSEPILDKLKQSMQDQLGFNDGNPEAERYIDDITKDFVKAVVSNVPETGTFDLKSVISSTYFFS